MGRRIGVQAVERREPIDPPAGYVELITADVRVYWPPGVHKSEVLVALGLAYAEATARVIDKFTTS